MPQHCFAGKMHGLYRKIHMKCDLPQVNTHANHFIGMVCIFVFVSSFHMIDMLRFDNHFFFVRSFVCFICIATVQHVFVFIRFIGFGELNEYYMATIYLTMKHLPNQIIPSAIDFRNLIMHRTPVHIRMRQLKRTNKSKK